MDFELHQTFVYLQLLLYATAFWTDNNRIVVLNLYANTCYRTAQSNILIKTPMLVLYRWKIHLFRLCLL